MMVFIGQSQGEYHTESWINIGRARRLVNGMRPLGPGALTKSLLPCRLPKLKRVARDDCWVQVRRLGTGMAQTNGIDPMKSTLSSPLSSMEPRNESQTPCERPHRDGNTSGPLGNRCVRLSITVYASMCAASEWNAAARLVLSTSLGFDRIADLLDRRDEPDSLRHSAPNLGQSAPHPSLKGAPRLGISRVGRVYKEPFRVSVAHTN